MNIMTKLKAGAASVLGRLPGLSTSTEFAEALPQIDEEIAAAEVRLAALEARREEAIFTSPEALADLGAAIDAASQEIKTLRIARDGAERRRLDAVERERLATLERTMAGAEADNRALTAAYLEFDAAATQLVALAGRIRDLNARIAEANALAHNSDRRDLRVETVIARFNSFLLAKAGRPVVNMGILDPADRAMCITGYTPAPSGFSDFIRAEG